MRIHDFHMHDLWSLHIFHKVDYICPLCVINAIPVIFMCLGCVFKPEKKTWHWWKSMGHCNVYVSTFERIHCIRTYVYTHTAHSLNFEIVVGGAVDFSSDETYKCSKHNGITESKHRKWNPMGLIMFPCPPISRRLWYYPKNIMLQPATTTTTTTRARQTLRLKTRKKESLFNIFAELILVPMWELQLLEILNSFCKILNVVFEWNIWTRSSCILY